VQITPYKLILQRRVRLKLTS